MSKNDPEVEKKVKEGKKAAKAATKKKQSNDAKKAAEKVIMTMAENQPVSAGGAKEFLKCVAELQKSKARKKAENLVWRGIRGRLKEMKIELRVLDQVMKLMDMDPEDARAYKATQALYEEQLGGVLTDEQKDRLAEINQKREDARKAFASINGNGTGKEVGTAAAGESEADEDKAGEEDTIPAAPKRNETVGSSFRPIVAASTNTH